LSNLDYARLAEISGTSPLAAEAMNCSAPSGSRFLLSLRGATAASGGAAKGELSRRMTNHPRGWTSTHRWSTQVHSRVEDRRAAGSGVSLSTTPGSPASPPRSLPPRPLPGADALSA
jgi:hypothetical protein